MRKMITSIAAILAVSALMVGAAFAGADKLVVKGTDGTTTKFSVQDDGNITTTGGFFYDAVNKRAGVGTTTPTTALHVASDDGLNPLRGLTNSQHNTGAQAAVINFVKSGGTQASPVQPAAGDYIGVFTGQYWNGTQYDRSAQFGFRNDGTVTAGSFPTAIMFFTGSKTVPTSDLGEAMRISSSKNVIVGNAGGSAAADMATNVTNGFLYIPNVAGALTTCSTVTAVAGHVPVWFDTTNAKICTCQSGALKCTTALQ